MLFLLIQQLHKLFTLETTQTFLPSAHAKSFNFQLFSTTITTQTAPDLNLVFFVNEWERDWSFSPVVSAHVLSASMRNERSRQRCQTTQSSPGNWKQLLEFPVPFLRTLATNVVVVTARSMRRRGRWQWDTSKIGHIVDEWWRCEFPESRVLVFNLRQLFSIISDSYHILITLQFSKGIWED